MSLRRCASRGLQGLREHSWFTQSARANKILHGSRWHPGSPLAEPIETKRRLVAIFAADVEGYSHLMGADEVATLDTLTARREILDRLCDPRGPHSQHRRRQRLAEFGSAVDAVRCAMEAQDALAQANSALPQTRHINFRMGIHVGDVMVRAGDLFGDGVNIAARLQTLAKAGGLCVSGVTYDQVRKILPLEFTDLGRRQSRTSRSPYAPTRSAGWGGMLLLVRDTFQLRVFPSWCCHLQTSAAALTKTILPMV